MNQETSADINSLNSFPGYTDWKKSKFCCFDSIYIPSIQKHFFGHWEISCGFPISVYTIIITSYLFGMIFVIPSFHYQTLVFNLMIIFSVLFFLFAYSYFRILHDGPGYFPFYWPDSGPAEPGEPLDTDDPSHSSSLLHSLDDIPEGIISTPDQLKWCKQYHLDRPNRCVLSRSARRIVIRPDHFCDWAACWIGKRNHKFFILFNLWGAIYIFFFFICSLVGVVLELRSPNPSFIFIFYFIYIFLAVFFLFFTGFFASDSISLACKNRTNWEDWSNVDPHRFDTGSPCDNIQDICGQNKALWLLPISPFSSLSNWDLIKDYEKSYRDIPLTQKETFSD